MTTDGIINTWNDTLHTVLPQDNKSLQIDIMHTEILQARIGTSTRGTVNLTPNKAGRCLVTEA